MTVDIQMDTDKGDVEMDKGDAEMRDADKDSKLNIDHLEESENGVCGAKLETQDQEHAETQANDEPVQEEPLQDCSELPVDNIAEGNVDGQPTNSDGELPGDNIAEGNVDVQPTNSDGELPGDNIAEGNVDGQPGKSEDKPDVLVNSEILDGSKSIAPDVKEDPSNTQGTQEHSSIMSESITETEQICSNSDNDGGKVAKGEIDNQEKLLFQLPVSEVPPKRKTDENILSVKEESVNKLLDKPHQIKAEVLLTEPKGTEKSDFLQTDASEDNLHLAEKTVIEVTKPSIGNSPVGNRHLPATPDLATQSSTIGSGSHNGRVRRSSFSEVSMTEFDDGTPEEQAAFVKELEGFYRERDVEFKPPKFYGHLLNLLKLWRAVIKLGGYDLVTGSKSWRNVGESFHPPKTCTTVSWTFRIFYEKSLLEYERYLRQIGELHLPEAAFSELASIDNEGNGQQASGSGRARRDAAARAMQGWHVQRLFGHNEDKNGTSMPKRENKVKSIGSIKQKRPDEIELPVKAQRTETSKQLATSVVDIGAPADWVKINVRETKDCFEVYALVPGLLREEVRVQSDPAGRLVITGQPEQPDNPWGITAFRKVVTLPARIDPLQTSAVVSLHGRLFVRVPFEQ